MRGHNRWLPLAYLGAAFAMVIFLVPTALRPPPSQPPTSAELNPDVPPEDSEILLAELARAKSATAGTGPSQQVVPGVEGLPIPAKPRRGKCYGNPPRQTESLYSPPCAAAWVGDNGGKTAKGVSATEVRIGVMRDGSTAYEGPVDRAPADEVDGVLRTWQAYERYFNEKFELYGRRVRLFIASTATGRSGNAKNAVIKLDDNYDLFAVITLDAAASIEATRRKIILMGGYNNNVKFHAANAPFSYSFTVDGSTLVNLTSEYICKQFWGKPVSFAGDPTFNGQPRKYGIIQYNDPAYFGYAEDFEADFKRRCGGVVAERLFYNGSDLLDDGLQIMTKFKAAGITSIIWMGEYIGLAVGTAQGTGQSYFPEWMGAGGGGTDINAAAQLSDKAQMRNMVGITSLEMAMPKPWKDYYRAYKEVDPDGIPDTGPRFSELLQLVGGIQQAGPKLTPQTFQEGMFRRWPKRPPEPVWTIGGGYGAGDYTYPDYVAIEWFDNAAIDPDTGNPGAWRHVLGGKRFTHEEVPAEPLPFFKEGISEPPYEPHR